MYNTPRLSRDGRWLALARADSEGNNDLFVYQFGRGVLRRLTFGPLYDGFPAWSPDGRQIVLAAGVGGVVNVHLRDIAGEGQQKRLTQSVNGQLVDDWSSDSRYIVYTEVHPTTLGDLWVIDMRNAPESDPMRHDKAPLLATAFNKHTASFLRTANGSRIRRTRAVERKCTFRAFPPSAKVRRVYRGRRLCEMAAGWEGVILCFPGWPSYGRCREA